MLKHHDLTDRIIKAFYKVYNKLGYGFPEKVYHNALTIELRNRGLDVQFQPPIQVRYEGHIVGDFFPDLVVNALVILELKAVSGLIADHGTQLTNYLKRAGSRSGYFSTSARGPSSSGESSTIRRASMRSKTSEPFFDPSRRSGTGHG